MEDLHTIKNHFAYQLRLDLSHNPLSELLINTWIDKFNVSHYLFGREFKPTNNIPHYQGIVWFENKLMDKQMTLCRNWFRNKTIKTDGNGHSFTSARKVANLGKYCKKDGNYYTSLSSQQIDTLGNWDTKAALRLQAAEKLNKLLHGAIPAPVTFYRFLSIFDKLYWSVYDNNPTRNTVLKYARKMNCLTRTRYYQMIGLIERDSHECLDYLDDEIITYNIGSQCENEKYNKETIDAYT